MNKLSGIILVVLLGLVAFACDRKMQQYKTRAKMLEESINHLNQDIKYFEVRLNDSIASYQAEVNNINATKSNLQARYIRLLEASQIKLKDVNSVTEVASVIRNVDTVIAKVDTFGGIKINSSDAYVNINVEVFSDRKTIIDYTVRDSLTIINIQKRHSLLFGLIKWKEHKKTRVANANPKATIVDLQTIEIIE